MDERYESKVRALRAAVLEGGGASEASARGAAEARAAEIAGRAGSGAGSLREALRPYVEKVAQHAYKVVDRDITALHAAGYSEAAIFEITISAALGAALGRLERGLAVLRGGGAECG